MRSSSRTIKLRDGRTYRYSFRPLSRRELAEYHECPSTFEAAWYVAELLLDESDDWGSWPYGILQRIALEVVRASEIDPAALSERIQASLRDTTWCQENLISWVYPTLTAAAQDEMSPVEWHDVWARTEYRLRVCFGLEADDLDRMLHPLGVELTKEQVFRQNLAKMEQLFMAHGGDNYDESDPDVARLMAAQEAFDKGLPPPRPEVAAPPPPPPNAPKPGQGAVYRG